MGSWVVSLNKDRTTYVLDLKVTAGGHEGSTNLAIDRDTWAYNRPLSAGWACGVGHTEGNQLTYSPELDKWARLCWTDGNSGIGTDNTNKWATYFQTLPKQAGNTREMQILKLPGGDKTGNGVHPAQTDGPGGVATIIS